jgi:hypothetical protein
MSFMISLLFASGLSGNVVAGDLKILGFEDASCQTWTQSKADPEQRAVFLAWARGFLSGHNYANQRQQVTDVSRSTVELYIERFCREKPKAQFIDGVFKMSDEYSGRGSAIKK